MAVSLSDLSGGIGGDMVAYRKYVIEATSSGKTELSYEDWVAAGTPPATVP